MLSTLFKKSTFSLVGATKTNAAAAFSGLRPSMSAFFTKRSLVSLGRNATVTTFTSTDTTATTTTTAETKYAHNVTPSDAPFSTTTKLKRDHVGALLYVFPEYNFLVKKMKRGVWSLDERERFCDFFTNWIRKEPGQVTRKDLQKISDYVGSRSVSQCSYHLRYYYK